MSSIWKGGRVYPILEEKLKEWEWKDEDLAVCIKVSPVVAYNKRHGRTRFTPLEKEVLSVYMKVAEEELFKEEE